MFSTTTITVDYHNVGSLPSPLYSPSRSSHSIMYCQPVQSMPNYCQTPVDLLMRLCGDNKGCWWVSDNWLSIARALNTHSHTIAIIRLDLSTLSITRMTGWSTSATSLPTTRSALQSKKIMLDTWVCVSISECQLTCFVRWFYCTVMIPDRWHPLTDRLAHWPPHLNSQVV